MKKRLIVCLGIFLGALAGCASPRHAAPVVDRTPVARPTETARTRPSEKAAEPRQEGRGFYTVKRGDTLYRIALEFGQNYRDIVAWNKLSSPNDIRIGQVLRVLPPDQLASGTQVGSVGAGSPVEVRPLGAPAASASATSGAEPVHKSGPRGDKRPWSAANMAEMQKPDGETAAPAESARPAEPATNGAETAALDWIWPTEGKVVSTFESNKKGIDIAGRMGQPVVAVGPGTVLYASSVRGYGNLVIIKHTNTLLSAYAHNKTIVVKEGQNVNKGQKIAEMGNSDSETVKLHFEIRQQGKPVDPTKFLPGR